ncbi:MAG: hypothetical protein JWO48_2664 [Bryobacterales bacterium]|nr:hypothetical protein [Bryobacterales bacterium]
MRIHLLIAICVVLSGAALLHSSHSRAAAAAKTAEAEWPQWLGANHDGKSTETGLLKEWPADGPKLLWKVTTLGKGYGTPAVASGMVYVTGDEGRKFYVYAFDMSGKSQGKIEHGQAFAGDHPGARGTPSIDGSNLYVLGGTGLLGCYDAKTGARKWQHEMKEYGGGPGGWGYAESPLVYRNLVIVKAGGKHCIVALDKTSGKGVWSSTGFSAGPEYGSCIPVSFGEAEMIVTGTNEGLVAVNAKNGALLWGDKFAAGNTANCPTPAFSDGYVFWANGYGAGGVCMKLKPNGAAEQAWTTKEMDCHHGGYIIENGYIYGNHGGGWTCLDLKTGQKKWYDHGVGKGSLCYADGMLYLFSENNGNCALATCSPEGLKITGRVQVEGSGESWAHPVVAGGRLYLRYDKNLYCFDVKGK